MASNIVYTHKNITIEEGNREDRFIFFEHFLKQYGFTPEDEGGNEFVLTRAEAKAETRSLYQFDRTKEIYYVFKIDGVFAGFMDVSRNIEKDDDPEVNNVLIFKKYRHTKLGFCIIDLLTNVLFPDRAIILGGTTAMFGGEEYAKKRPGDLTFTSEFKPGIAERAKKILEKDLQNG
ncbi:MAG: hypothetical protein KAH01_05920 [Caldisericia bacterium]|nr:hypothetical protein [Caldisericia bacterium]